MKNKNVALVLCLLTGALGGHHYYLGNWRKGVYRFLLTCLSIIIVLAFINEHINMLIPLACYIPLLIDFIRIAFDPKYIVNYKTINFKEDMKEAVKEEMQKKQFKSEGKRIEKEKLSDLRKQGIPYCPKCHSTSIHAEKRGWKVTTGLIGSSKIVVTCLNCGHKFKPGKSK